MTAGSSGLRPWNPQHVTSLCVTSLIGLVSVTVAWFAVSGSARTDIQALWLDVAVGGLVVSGLGNVLWLARGRWAVGRRRASLVFLQEKVVPVELGRNQFADTLTTPPAIVRVEGMRRVHAPECFLVAGKPWHVATINDGEPCGMCLP